MFRSFSLPFHKKKKKKWWLATWCRTVSGEFISTTHKNPLHWFSPLYRLFQTPSQPHATIISSSRSTISFFMFTVIESILLKKKKYDKRWIKIYIQFSLLLFFIWLKIQYGVCPQGGVILLQKFNTPEVWPLAYIFNIYFYSFNSVA